MRRPPSRRALAARSRALDVAALWASLGWLSDLWRRAGQGPPPGWRAGDDGPDDPAPEVRGIAWVAARNAYGRRWWADLEALLREDVTP